MSEALSIFILPPSKEELESRLRGRGTDSDEVIAKRLGQSCDDIKHYDEFDYVVINDVFDESVEQLASIFHANRITLKKQQQINKALLNDLSD
jgi:guanylate kinase